MGKGPRVRIRGGPPGRAPADPTPDGLPLGDRPGATKTARASNQGASLRLHVRPGARRSEIVGPRGDALKVSVVSPPERGRANDEVVDLLATALGVGRSAVRIVRGHASRDKNVAVEGLSQDEVERRLGLERPRRD